MIEFRTIDLDNIRLHYAEAPGPGPALVILHGLTGSHTEFLHLAPELARQAHVYVLDLRGHGLSGRRAGAYRIADYGHDVIDFLYRVVTRPAVLVGHSLGGLVTIWLAARVPNLLRAISLSEPPLYIMEPPRFSQASFYHYFVDLRRHLNDYHVNGASLEQMIAYLSRMPLDAERTWLDVAGPEAVRARAIQLHQVDPAVLDPAIDNTLMAGHEPDALLAQIRCPVQLLAAQAAMSVQDVERAVLQMPHCTYAVIENSGHDIHLDQPEAYLYELQQFLAGIRIQKTAQPRSLIKRS